MESNAAVMAEIEAPSLKKVLLLREEVYIAMDGRTNRNVCMDVKIHEAEFSRKMKGKLNFTEAEIERLNKRLQSNIIYREE